jgi:hypothetical protein
LLVVFWKDLELCAKKVPADKVKAKILCGRKSMKQQFNGPLVMRCFGTSARVLMRNSYPQKGNTFRERYLENE